jgi:hypothetical protein
VPAGARLPIPRFDRLLGVELRPGIARIAADALRGEAEIITGDAAALPLPPADCALLFDVLHLMPAASQESLLRALAGSMAPGGVMVVREADAGAGWRFAAVRLGNRLKALAVGRWRQEFHFRTAPAWIACFGALGLRAEVRPMGQGTPFGNVLFRITAAEAPALRPALTAGSDRGI